MPPPLDAAPPLVPRETSLDELEHALATTLADATPSTKDELRRLATYRPPPAVRHIDFPKNKLAAVLVLLHLNPLGELSVTLTTRSSRLRSHPGETALPGGRWEEGDGEGGVWTAYREAHEEIGLPLPPRDTVFPSTSTSSCPPDDAPRPPSHLVHLTTLAPFTSRTLLVVLPVVALLVEPAATATTSYLPRVLVPSPDEVAAVFHLPLRAFLLRPRPADSPSSAPSSAPSTRPSTRSTPRPRPAPGTESLTHSFADFAWLLERPYRLHSFASADEGVTPSAVTGLTADIVVRCAMVAESGSLGVALGGERGSGDEREGEGLREPGFEREADGQLGWEETIRVALGLEGRVGLGERVWKEGNGEGGRSRGEEERGEGRDEERRAAVLARA
ncbi:hypothetical protein JCM3775_000558 [Rhodotorula graminis]